MKELNPNKLSAAVKYIDKWLTFNFDDSDLPGMQVAIQHKDNLIYTKSFGYADIENKKKLSNKNTFRIASHSKTFTATAIMQLVESGKLGLDDSVSMHLTWFKSHKDKRVSEITVRQLLNHTAGVIRDGLDSDYWQLLRDFPDAKELKEYINEAALFYDSDEIFKYSNYGYGYLGLLVESVSGQPYREYVKKHIVKRLGIDSTGPDLDSTAENTLAVGYGIKLFNREQLAYEHADTHDLSSATGFYSNAENVCKYFSAHFLGNEVLLSDKSKRLMQHGYWKAKGTDQSYGLGMITHKKKGWKLYGHGGGFPGFITNTLFEPNLGLVVTVLTNAYGAKAGVIGRKLINIMDTFQQDTPKTTQNPEKFEGRFYCTWGIVDIVAVGSKLFAVEPKDWTDFEEAEQLEILDSNTLKIVEASGYSYPGELIKFGSSKNTINYAGRTMLGWEDAIKKKLF